MGKGLPRRNIEEFFLHDLSFEKKGEWPSAQDIGKISDLHFYS
jgi:hypothetical protein